uniref:Uncharacterized protein n=1 Tax=Anguilla anguilla TaxID=7936 RepID=A0A0E9QK47_ANGAN
MFLTDESCQPFLLVSTPNSNPSGGSHPVIGNIRAAELCSIEVTFYCHQPG